MAKVTAPLMSMDASGKLGNALVYLRGGVVRKYVVPANPKTQDQMEWRAVLGDIQRTLKALGATLRGQVRAGFGSNWGATIIGELLRNDAAQVEVYSTEFATFSAQNKADWTSAAPGVGYVGDGGLYFYVTASAVYAIANRLGLTITLSEPTQSNSATVAGQWVA